MFTANYCNYSDSASNSLSAGAAAVITFVLTFILTLTATVIITFTVTYIYLKKKFETLLNYKNQQQSPQEEPLYELIDPLKQTTTISKKIDLKLQLNPAYDLNHKVITDTNPTYESCN